MAGSILIVDSSADSTALRELLKEKFTVTEANGSEELPAVLEQRGETLCAVIVDLTTPGKGGFEALRLLHDRAAQVPVLAVTSPGDGDTQVRALALGAAGLVFLPYNREILLPLLENIVSLRGKSALADSCSTDSLTGLLNRNAFFLQAAQHIGQHEPGYYVLSCFDIENFKVINDQYGLATGDGILRQIADGIRKSMEAFNGICCHDAADKFGMLFPAACLDSDEIKRLHGGITSARLAGHNVRIRVGRYLVNDKTLPVSAMYDRASLAEESIKGRYDTYVAFYTEEMRQSLVNEQQVVNDMARALEAGEFEPWFQPQYNHATGALIGAEALVRWRKDNTVIPPDRFIPIFERNGFIYEVDRYIWRRVCSLLRGWLDGGKNPLPVSVNISRCDLFQNDCVDSLCALMEEFGLPPDMLRLEVTESAFAESTGTVCSVVNELIKKGFTVEIDDFGSGYSSLNTLKDVPASILKLDMRFFERTGDARRGGNIVESVVRMAKWLGMAVIAEGVEDKPQADYLKSIGCYYIQGYYYARPMPQEEYERRLETSAGEAQLTRLQTLQNLDNNDFWDAHSMDTLIFNSYVGAACILERHMGKVEMLRATDHFARMLSGNELGIKDILAIDWRKHMDRRSIRLFKDAVSVSLETKETVVREFAFHNLPGCPETVILRSSLRVIAGVGERQLIYCLSDNITAQRVAEREALHASKRTSAVMDAMPNGMTAVVLHKDSMQLLFANERYYELHGLKRGDREKAQPADVRELALPEYREALRSAFDAAAETGQSVTVEYRNQHPDGSVRWVRANISMTALADVDDPVQVAVFADITAEREATDRLRFLNDTAGVILAQSDSEQAIQDTLLKLRSYFAADRSYVMELDRSRRVMSNTYEVCADGIEPEMDNRQELAYTQTDSWYEELSHNGFFVIRDVGTPDGRQAKLRETLLAQGIRSIILAPMWSDGHLIAFIGVENPSHRAEQPEQLKALSDYCTVLLTRRDLVRKITHDSETVQQLMDDTPGGFVRMELFKDKAPAIVNINDNLCKMLGMTKDEVIKAYGDNVFAALAEEDAAVAAEELQQALISGGQYTGTCRLRKKDGELFWVMLFGRFAPDENGRLFLNAYFTDITQKLAAEENQKTLLDNLPFGAAMYKFDGEKLTVIHINRRYWRLVGRAPTKYEKTSVTDAIHPEDRALTVRELQAAIRQERSAAVDIRILDGSGGYTPFHVTASAVLQADGSYRLFAAYSPISNEALSLQEMLPVAMSTMMATSEDISYIKGKDLHYIACSQALAKLAGAGDARDLIGKNAYDLFDWTFAEKFTEDDRNIIETGKAVIDAIEHIPTGDGGISLARTSKYPIRDAAGDVIGVYCISHDVTAQRRRDSLLDLLTGSIPGGLASFSVSREGIKTLYFNDGFYDYSGYTRAEYTELTNREPLALMLEEDKDKLRALLRVFAAERRDGMTGSCDYRCRTRDGQIRYMSLKAVLTQLDADQYVLNVVQLDMTPHVEIEQRMENLLDNLPFGAAMYEFDGEALKALHINRQFQRMVGRQKPGTDPGSYSPVDFVHPDDRSVALSALKEAVAGHRDASCRIRLLCGRDEYRPFRLEARITAQPDGKYLVYTAFTRLPEQEQTFENALPHIFSTIMESSTDLAFAKDINFRYICCSRTFATLLGLASEDEVVGKTDYELFPEEIADMFRRDDASLITSQKPQIDIQEMLPSPDGTRHYIRTSKHLLRNDTDTVIGIYCIGRDVTEIREAYAQLRLLTDSIPGGIATFRCSPGSIEVLYFNDGVCTLVGCSREEYEAHPVPLPEFIFAEDRPIVHRQLALLRSGETSLNFTVRIHPKNGGYKWVNIVAAATDRIGESYTVNTVLTDVTGQQEEREQLRRAEEEYRIATSHSGHTIGRYDIASRTLTISEDASVRLALPETIPNVPYGRVKLGKISGATAKEYIAFYEKIMSGEKECSVTFQKLLSVGWRWIAERATTIFDDNGEPVSAIISYSDVTEQQEKEAIYKKWQQNLVQKGPESYTLYRCNLSRDASYDTAEGRLLSTHLGWNEAEEKTFNERNRDFAEHCVAQEDREMYLRFTNSDTMLAGYYRGRRSASMELRGLVASGEMRWLRLSVELVEYPNTTDVAAYLMYEDIHESKLLALRTQTLAETDPLTGILNRKTFISRMDKLLAARTDKALYALLLLDVDGFKRINDSFGHATGDRMLIDIAGALQSVLRSSDLVCRMGGDEFLICMSAMPNRDVILKKAKRIIRLMHSIAGGGVKLSVSAGIAVCPEDGNTFEALYPKVDKALYHVKGNGKNDCVFYDAGMKTALISTDGRSGTPVDPVEKPTMLIVDSDEDNRRRMANVFAGDFRVEAVPDGILGLDYLQQNEGAVTVVLLELKLPDMDGFTVLTRLLEQQADIPVIAVSGLSERDAALRAIRAGASDFVMKPIDTNLLRIRVESAVSRAENERLRAQNRFLSLVKGREE